MATKTVDVEGIGTVHLYKRRGIKNMRLSITSEGRIRLTIPYWIPYAAGLSFARSRSEWIITNLPLKDSLLMHGQQIGKAHRLLFIPASTSCSTARIAGSEIRIKKPLAVSSDDPAVQQVAANTCKRALRLQAAKLLPVRLKKLAEAYGFEYDSVQIKQLKGRWGSCDAKKRIVLNLYLMQLPWHLIDYVLLHELVHTKHLHHGPDFWDEFLFHEPQAKAYRLALKNYRPALETITAAPTVA